MPSAYLHIGAHKTGTSAFQVFLRDQRAWLSARGLYVPITGQEPTGAHHGLAAAISGRRRSPEFAAVRTQLKRELRKARYPDIIVSSESIHAGMWRRQSVERYYDFFSKLGYDVVVIYYLRSELQAFCSEYSQMVKTFKYHEPLDVYIDDQLKLQKIATNWKLLLAHGGLRHVIRPYNRDVKNRGIVRSLLSELGIEDEPPATRSVNNSPSWIEVHVCRELLRTIQASVSAERLSLERRHLLMAEVERVMAGWDGDRAPYYGITQEAASRLDAALQAGREEMSQTLWNKPWQEAFPGELGRRFEVNDPEIVPLSPGERARVDGLVERLHEARASMDDRARRARRLSAVKRFWRAMSSFGKDRR